MFVLSQSSTTHYYVAHIADLVLFIAQLALPVFFVFRWKTMRWRVIGVFLGTFTFYIIGLISGFRLKRLDPERFPLLDLVWIHLGYVLGFIYCLILFAIRSGLERRKASTKEA